MRFLLSMSLIKSTRTLIGTCFGGMAVSLRTNKISQYLATSDVRPSARPRPPSWWKFVSSVSMPEKFLPQLPYNERSQSDQGLGIPLKQPSTASLVLDLSIHRFVAGGSDH